MKVEFILALALIMWLFNKLSFVKQPVQDIVNSVVIVLLIIVAFYFRLLTL